jgi:hypothetical protein
MAGDGDPVEHRLRELIRHAGVRGRHQRGRPGASAFSVDRERQLDVQRLLGPQRAVVVERRDALGRRHERLTAGLGDSFDERNN